MNAMLMVFIVGVSGLEPLGAQPFERMADCQKAKSEVIEQLHKVAPKGTLYIAECATVRSVAERM